MYTHTHIHRRARFIRDFSLPFRTLAFREKDGRENAEGEKRLRLFLVGEHASLPPLRPSSLALAVVANGSHL